MPAPILELRARVHTLKQEGLALVAEYNALAEDDTEGREKSLRKIAEKSTAVTAAVNEVAAMEQRMDAERAFALSVDDGARVRVGASRETLDPTGGFAHLAEFALSVRAAGAQGSTIDPRLNFRAAPTNFHQEAGTAEGYEVPAQFSSRVFELVFEQDDLLAEVDSEPTSSNSVEMTADESTPWGSSGVNANWLAEGKQMSADKLSTKDRTLKLHKLYAYVLAGEELLEDAPRLNARLTTKSAQAINWKINEAIIEGGGVGKPLGWMKSAALVSVAKETSQAADTLNAQNVLKMFSRMMPSSIPRAHWRINSDVLPQLGGLTIGDQPVYFLPQTGIASAPGGFLLGRPVRISEHCETLGDKGDIQFVDPMGYYLARKTDGVKFAQSMHLYFDYDMQAFRWTFRLGGQPHLSAAVSPAKGSNTKSHFVTLDARA